MNVLIAKAQTVSGAWKGSTLSNGTNEHHSLRRVVKAVEHFHQ